MKAVLNKWTYIEEKVLIGSLIFNTLLIFLQIIMRGAFNSSLSWSEELSRYIFIWQIWLGADLAFAYGEHIKVEMIYNWLPGEKAKNMLRILVEAAWLAFNIFLVVKGADLCQSMVSRNTLSSGMRAPLVYVYAALPVASFFLRVLCQMLGCPTTKSPFRNSARHLPSSFFANSHRESGS
ncbi:TRAP transporter small permease [Prevotella corporis]|uniref:TRAP transporter small permease n=1 Tax=Prevotella corporis TaxID=28128 RepID=UPI0023F638BD|nr:TRAP transporter small permease subunit [Prevotella corporis]